MMKNIFSVTSVAILFCSFAAEAQDHFKRGFNDGNNWDKMNISLSYGVAHGYHSIPSKTSSQVIRLSAENIPASPIFGWGSAIADVAIGYDPSGFFRLRYLVSPFDKGLSDNRLYFIIPLVGDINLRPGMNQLRHKLSKNLSISASLGGVGYMGSGKLGANDGSSWRAAGAVKYVVFSEMISPGLYSYGGAEANGRESVNGIDTTGWSVEMSTQFSLINKVLLGLGGEGARLKQDNYNPDVNGGSDIEYYNVEGRVYARVRVLGKRKLTLDLDANCYLRFTNMNNFRVNETRSYPGIGARLGFYR